MRSLAVPSLLLLVSGCLSDLSSGSGSTPSGSGGPVLDGGPIDGPPPFIELDGGTSVGPAGGELAIAGATLTIPAGALRTPHNLLLQQALAAPALPPGWVALSPVFELAPARLGVATPATLSLAFAPAATPPVVLTAQPQTGWTAVPAPAFPAAGLARVEITQLALYVVATASNADAGAADAAAPDAAGPDADASAGQ